MSGKRAVKILQEAEDLYNEDLELAILKADLRTFRTKLDVLLATEVQDLRDKVADLQEQIRGRKAERVRTAGLAFASLDELNQKAGCRLHPEAKAVWISVGKLASKSEGVGVKGKLAELRRYELKCTECYLREVRTGKKRETSPDRVAHDCPNCGIVRAEPQKFSDRATGPYAGYQNSYIYYHCRVCGEELGCVIRYGITI